MLPTRIEEIETILLLSDIQSILIRTMLEDELFEI